MNSKNLLIKITLAAAVFYHSSCQQETDQATAAIADQNILTTETRNVTLANRQQTTPVTENFEQAQNPKPSYAAAAVSFGSGQWILDDALLASGNGDAQNDGHSIRMRNRGRLSMQFDVNGATGVSIMHAAYADESASSWQLWASEDGGTTYRQVGETIVTTAHELTRSYFKLNLNHTVRLEIRKVSGGKNRINIDDFKINTTGYRTAEPISQTTVVKSQLVDRMDYNSNLLLGNPGGAASSTSNADNYLIDHQYYVESYSKAKTGPNWVSWHIGSSDLGNTDRLNNFRPDTDLPDEWYEADNTSYKGSGFDKGHNCPSGDRTSSTAANSSTFLMDNIIPQAPNNNQHTWEHLESYCRDKVKSGNEVYVIMGSYGSGGTGRNGYATTIDQGRINVPSHIWKVVVILPDGDNDLQRINNNTPIIAIDTPNDNDITPNWMNYLCTVRDIEKATGYNLLSALPRSLQEVIETRKFSGGN